MKQIDFSIMNETVDKICESLLKEPENWKFGIWYIESPLSLGPISIEIGIQNTFANVKTEKSSIITARVFSMDQGRKIQEAYYQALSIVGSARQQSILNILKNENKSNDDNIIIKEENKDNIKKEINCFCIITLIVLFSYIIYTILNK